MTIAILLHLSGCRCFKWHCQERVSKYLASYFSPSGQLQLVCGTYELQRPPPCAVYPAFPAGDKTDNAAEKEHEEQADGYGGKAVITETGGHRIVQRLSEKHLPGRT
jgi:hypothetical protein